VCTLYDEWLAGKIVMRNAYCCTHRGRQINKMRVSTIDPTVPSRLWDDDSGVLCEYVKITL